MPARKDAGRKFSLAPFHPFVRWAVRALWTVAVVGVVVSTVAQAGGPGDPHSMPYTILYVALFVIPGVLCLVRAALVAEQRLAWAAFGIGMCCWAGGAFYCWRSAGLESPPYPSWSTGSGSATTSSRSPACSCS